MILKAEEKKSEQNSCYELDVMRNSYSKVSVPSVMKFGFTAMIDKDVMFLQNYINREKDMLSPCGETYPTSDDASQARDIKAEEVSNAEEEEDPVPMTFIKVKAEAEVSCMSQCVHC
jgi:hypothetical protein